MQTVRKALVAALTVSLLAPAAAEARHHDYYNHKRHSDRDHDRAVGAAIGLAIAGAAIAASAKRKRENDREDYDRNWGDTYRPGPEVTCYRASRQCFRRDHFSYEWTEREFGYDPYRRGY
mgnify:CR=1 FL=1|jgi:hypothetical protein